MEGCFAKVPNQRIDFSVGKIFHALGEISCGNGLVTHVFGGKFRQEVCRVDEVFLHDLADGRFHLLDEDALNEEGRKPHNQEECQKYPKRYLHDSKFKRIAQASMGLDEVFACMDGAEFCTQGFDVRIHDAV